MDVNGLRVGRFTDAFLGNDHPKARSGLLLLIGEGHPGPANTGKKFGLQTPSPSLESPLGGLQLFWEIRFGPRVQIPVVLPRIRDY